MSSQPICRDFMAGNCSRGDQCRFVHDPEVCYYFWKNGSCKWNDQCRHKHIPRKAHSQQNSNKKHENKRRHHAKNTESFTPSHQPADMRILVEARQNKTSLQFQTQDVVVIPDLFPEPDIYDRLVHEVENCGISFEQLFKLWHGDTHYIADDKKGWKEKCPTFQLVIDRITDYFGMHVQATRFNWFRTTEEWKPFHHDAAAVKPEKARTQNFTVGVSFGYPRDIAFEENGSKKVVSIPLPSGTTYAFTRDININWKHGVPQLPPNEHKPEGRISIIAWGWVEQKDV